jgi:hypothetical protein
MLQGGRDVQRWWRVAAAGGRGKRGNLFLQRVNLLLMLALSNKRIHLSMSAICLVVVQCNCLHESAVWYELQCAVYVYFGSFSVIITIDCEYKQHEWRSITVNNHTTSP